MTVTIPISIDEQEATHECVIELLDLGQQEVLAEVHRAQFDPGVHSIEFDPSELNGELEAGVYIIRVRIGENSSSYPLQYMP